MDEKRIPGAGTPGDGQKTVIKFFNSEAYPKAADLSILKKIAGSPENVVVCAMAKELAQEMEARESKGVGA